MPTDRVSRSSPRVRAPEQKVPGQPARGRAAIHAYEGDFNVAFDQLLEVALRDKAEWREKARLQLVEWFDACPDPATVSRGRRYLGMYLN